MPVGVPKEIKDQEHRVALTPEGARSLPYARRLAERGAAALGDDPWFAKGVNTYAGRITCEAVAEALDMRDRFEPFADVFEGSH